MAFQDQDSTSSLEDQVDTLTKLIDRLKVNYEQYFLGRERIPPIKLRERVDRMMLRLKQSQTRNTGLKFRINSLQSKLTSFHRLWDRTLQKMEEGKSNRDRFRIKMANRQTGEPPLPKKATKPQGARNKNVEALLNQFVSAKQKCQEPTKGVSYAAFAKTISTQTAALKKRYNCKTVRFKVVIENGKTKLKATPK